MICPHNWIAAHDRVTKPVDTEYRHLYKNTHVYCKSKSSLFITQVKSLQDPLKIWFTCYNIWEKPISFLRLPSALHSTLNKELKPKAFWKQHKYKYMVLHHNNSTSHTATKHHFKHKILCHFSDKRNKGSLKTRLW